MLTFLTVTGGGGPVNQAPLVSAGPDLTVALPASAALDGNVTDDGLPSGTLTTTWTKQSGLGTVTFGNANAVDTTASFSAAGTYVLRLTASDGALSAFDETTITVNPAPVASIYFSTVGNANPPGVSGTADDADIYYWNGSAFSRAIDASAAPYSLPATGGGNANVDGFDRVDATHFYMSFTGQVAVPTIGNVQDEDVVYYNAGAWSLFFDGSVNGIGGTDLDAISIVGGTLYFSTDDNDVMPGTSSPGDDADIYQWNGGSSYTRVYDASALGWSTNNVDGFVRIDATHFYLSYNPDTTTVTGPGTVQDEDILYYNNGIWSVYFDGTAAGLTSGNLDVDAFDLP
jgi:hypothetical protein